MRSHDDDYHHALPRQGYQTEPLLLLLRPGQQVSVTEVDQGTSRKRNQGAQGLTIYGADPLRGNQHTQSRARGSRDEGQQHGLTLGEPAAGQQKIGDDAFGKFVQNMPTVARYQKGTPLTIGTTHLVAPRYIVEGALY